ncbi:MAG: MFS transporter [Thermoguttaceae bacterium]|nr:MFS transporter [Thermoguttaceae bacterium]MDW8080149.1 MFS transporter [Thermoguttaceae bacterium]
MSSNTQVGRAQWLVITAAFLGWMCAGVILGLFPLAVRPAVQSLLNQPPEEVIGVWTGRINASWLLGAALGGLCFGWLGDRIGRVRSMAAAVAFFAIFTGLCYFATHPAHLVLFRFLGGMGIGGEWGLGVALVVEFWPERFRPYMAGVIGAAANVGFLLIALLATIIHITPDSWRWIMAAGASPIILAGFIWLAVPESKRWKAATQERPAHPVREIFRPPLLKFTLLAIIFSTVPLVATWGGVSGFLPVWADQLAGPKYPGAKGMVQVVVSIGAIIGCLVAPVIGGQVGRRPVYFTLCALSLLVCQILFREWWVYGPTFLFVCGIAGAVTAAFYGWMPLYLPELFPTRVRATGQGLSFNFGRILTAVGALGTGQLVAFFGGSYPKACSTITLIYVIGLVMIWLAPETKGRPLPD